MIFESALGIVAILAGAVASLAGFGIGSLLTPLLEVKTGIGVAVAGVSIAHFFGTALRCWLLRKHIDRTVLISFGLTSAAGGLAGAFLHSILQSTLLSIVFGILLILAGISGLTGLFEKMRLKGPVVWLAGLLSGLFGGLVGNQGGIRSAALLSFDLSRDQFVATATGIALMVDVARVPVYFTFQSADILSIWQYVMIATVGVVIGTLVGKKVLEKLPQNVFRKVVSALILAVGIYILVQR